MPAQLPGMLWRVVVTYPPPRRRGYLDPPSKNFADRQRALDYHDRAVSLGASSRIYVTICDWVESGLL